MKIGVVFLARSEDGSTKDFWKFFRSYREYDAGIDHELIVIRKGEARRSGASRAIEIMLEGIPFSTLDRSDEGFDIHAYIDAAQDLDHDYLCFLNTYSTICADKWLLKLVTPHLEDPTCGVTGATASYESLVDSNAVISKAIWLASGNLIPYVAELANEFWDELAPHAPVWMKERSESPPLPHGWQTGELHDRFIQHWRAITRSRAVLGTYALYKSFPNPHIRSNAFVIKRTLLNKLDFKVGFNKIDCCQFESGINGLPTRLAEMGLKQILVGANGKAYDVQDWPKSDTFRLGNQDNILVRDNQVIVYDDSSSLRRAHLATRSWGAYVDYPDVIIRKLGYPFAKSNLSLTFSPRARPICDYPIKISIVIPSRNRRELVMDALSTIISQNYENWECIVFDNASDEPIGPLVESLCDERITVIRSEEFLPVTESWNRAIDAATGTYVTLLGDDDGLAPLFMNSIDFISRHHDGPDLIYTSLFQFIHPGVAPWEPSGYVIDLRSGMFFEGEDDIFVLDPARAEDAVANSLGFKRSFAFNMQAFCFERNFLDSIRQDGKVFHSPFPDYYLANVAFAAATRITVAPKPIAIAGVSKKSFGFTLFNGLEKEGAALLATKLSKDPLYGNVRDVILPGPDYNTNYLLTMMHVSYRLKPFYDISPDIERYRNLQILSNIFPDLNSDERRPVPDGLSGLLTYKEKAWLDGVLDLADRAEGDPHARAELRDLRKATNMYGREPIVHRLDTGSYADLPELYDAMSDGVINAVTI